MILWIAIISAVTGFLFGFDEGIISGVLNSINKEFELTHTETGFMMGLLPFGALIAACVSGRFSDWIGRLHVLLVIAVLFSMGTLGILLTHSFPVLCAMRFILGLSIGMSVVVTPIYIAETAPPEIRGKLVTYFQLAITLGILCSYIVNFFMVGIAPWRYVFATGLIPCALLFGGTLFLPESPRWLFSKGKTLEAEAALLKLYTNKAKRDKMEKEIISAHNLFKKEEKKNVFFLLFSRKFFPCLVLGFALFFFQQVSGINAIIYYAPIIFHELNIQSLSAQLLATVGIGTLNVIVTLLAIHYIEKLGRRLLLIIGFAGTTLALSLIAVASQFQTAAAEWISGTSIFLFIAAFAFGLGPLPYVIASEVFPIKVRGQGMSLSAVSNWGFNTLVVASFPVLVHSVGVSYVFLLYAIACLLGLLFTLRYTPETKGLSLEKIERHVQSGKPLKSLGRL